MKVLSESREYMGHEVYLPEVVVDEVVAAYRDRIKEQVDDGRRASKKLRGLTGEAQFEAPSGDLTNQLAERFRERFVERARELGFDIHPYPKVPHNDVVRRILAAGNPRRPFTTREEKGYRDTLISETVLEIAALGNEPVALISDDGGFRDNGRLHPDLGDDLEQRGISPDRIHVVRQVKDFNSTFVSTLQFIGVDTIDDLLFEIQIDQHPWSRLWNEAVWSLDRILPDIRVDRFDVEVPPDADMLRLMAVEDIRYTDVDGLTPLPSGQFLINGWAEVKCSFEATLRVTFEFTVDPKSDTATSEVEVTSIKALSQSEPSGGDMGWDE